MTCGGGRAPEGVLLLRCLCEQPLWSLLLLWLALTSRRGPPWEKGCMLRGGHSAAQRPDGGDARGSAVPSCPALLLGTPQSLPAGVPSPSGLLCVDIQALLPSPGSAQTLGNSLMLVPSGGGNKGSPPPPHSSTTPTINSLQLSFLSDQRFRKQSSKQVPYRHGHLTGE